MVSVGSAGVWIMGTPFRALCCGRVEGSEAELKTCTGEIPKRPHHVL